MRYLPLYSRIPNLNIEWCQIVFWVLCYIYTVPYINFNCKYQAKITPQQFKNLQPVCYICLHILPTIYYILPTIMRYVRTISMEPKHTEPVIHSRACARHSTYIAGFFAPFTSAATCHVQKTTRVNIGIHAPRVPVNKNLTVKLHTLTCQMSFPSIDLPMLFSWILLG